MLKVCKIILIIIIILVIILGDLGVGKTNLIYTFQKNNRNNIEDI